MLDNDYSFLFLIEAFFSQLWFHKIDNSISSLSLRSTMLESWLWVIVKLQQWKIMIDKWILICGTKYFLIFKPTAYSLHPQTLIVVKRKTITSYIVLSSIRDKSSWIAPQTHFYHLNNLSTKDGPLKILFPNHLYHRHTVCRDAGLTSLTLCTEKKIPSAVSLVWYSICWSFVKKIWRLKLIKD